MVHCVWENSWFERAPLAWSGSGSSKATLFIHWWPGWRKPVLGAGSGLERNWRSNQVASPPAWPAFSHAANAYSDSALPWSPLIGVLPMIANPAKLVELPLLMSPRPLLEWLCFTLFTFIHFSTEGYRDTSKFQTRSINHASSGINVFFGIWFCC